MNDLNVQNLALLEGVIFKQGTFFKRWKQRYIIVTSKSILSYEKKTDKKPRSVYNPSTSFAVFSPSQSHPSRVILHATKHGSHKAKQHCIDVSPLNLNPHFVISAFGVAKMISLLEQNSIPLFLRNVVSSQQMVSCYSYRAHLLQLKTMASYCQGLLQRKKTPNFKFEIKPKVSNFEASISAFLTQRRCKREKAIAIIQGFMSGLSRRRRFKNKQRRKRIANELLTTELSYVNNLQMTERVFLRPLQNILQEQVWNIFIGFSDIVKINKKFLSLLQNAITSKSHVSSKLADVFNSEIESIRGYATFVRSFTKITVSLDGFIRDNPKVVEILERGKPETNGLQLRDFLIMPVQRPPRYVLLLQDYLRSFGKRQGKHAKELQKGLNKLVNLIKEFNEDKRFLEDSERLSSLKVALGIKPKDWWPSFGTRIVKEGAVSKVGDGNYVILLSNDILILKSKGAIAGQPPITLKQTIHLSDIVGSPKENNGKGVSGVLILNIRDGKELKIHTSLFAEVSCWKELIVAQINSLSTSQQ